MDAHMVFYTSITAVLVCMMVIYSWLVYWNSTFTLAKKIGFMLSAFFLAAAALFEYFGYYAISLGEGYRALTLAMASFQFIFSMFTLETVLFTIGFPKKKLTFLLLSIPICITIVLVVVSCFTGAAFAVSEQNVYERGPWHWVFYVCYAFYATLLLIVAFKENARYQRKDFIGVFSLLIASLAAAIIFQALNENARLDFLVSGLCLSFYTSLYNDARLSVDPLTGLLNRFFLENFKTRKGHDYIIILFDIDDFKIMNDVYGHTYGDEVLKFVAKTILASFGTSGYVIRYGGDEFVCLIKKRCEKEHLTEMETAFFARLIAERETDPRLPYISYGVTAFKGGSSIIDVFNAADEDLYAHKQENKDKRKNAA